MSIQASSYSCNPLYGIFRAIAAMALDGWLALQDVSVVCAIMVLSKLYSHECLRLLSCRHVWSNQGVSFNAVYPTHVRPCMFRQDAMPICVIKHCSKCVVNVCTHTPIHLFSSQFICFVTDIPSTVYDYMTLQQHIWISPGHSPGCTYPCTPVASCAHPAD